MGIKRLLPEENMNWQRPILEISNNGTPDKGNRYIVGESPTGEFAGLPTDSIAWYDGTEWQRDIPDDGWVVYDLNQGELLFYANGPSGDYWYYFRDLFGSAGGDGTDPDAIHVNVAQEILNITENSTPNLGGRIVFEDEDDSWNKKSISLADLATALIPQLQLLTIGDVYPVGSIYIELTGTNPAVSLGVGTWVAFGTGRTLVGINGGDPDFDTVEETGGAKTHTHSVTSNVAVGNHADHTHNVTSNVEVGNHTETAVDATLSFNQRTFDWNADEGVHAVTNNEVVSAGANSTLSHSVTNNAVTSGAGSSVQPYIVVYMWKRTA